LRLAPARDCPNWYPQGVLAPGTRKGCHYISLGSAACPLAQAEDDELGRFYGCQADINEQLAAITYIAGIIFLVALDEEGLLRRTPEEHAIPPRTGEECADVAF